ncbi:hypothetical protein [Corynebacterium resistens]|uniref:hypothetical protein n=1 Tax=Corynebacterium resistens TaxID=258224 RepID=UPI002357DEF9|nr:hypothetical protein [Corynebacterium resistens]
MGKFSTRKAVAGGVLTAAGVFGIGAAAAPEALAQLAIPGLPPINLPGVPGGKPAQNNIPGGQKNTGQGDQPGGGNGARDDQGAKTRSHQRNQQANPIPGLPPLPKPPQLPKPPRIKPPEIPERYRMDLTPPGPIQGLKPLQNGTFTIKTDETALLGKVKLSLIQQQTPQGLKPAIRIDANKAVLKNLSVDFPDSRASAAAGGDIWQRTGRGQTTTLEGNFHIVVSKLTVTPRLAGVPLFPLTIDATMAPKQIQKEAKKIGLGNPDALSEQLVMLNGTMDTYFVKADKLVAGAGNRIG